MQLFNGLNLQLFAGEGAGASGGEGGADGATSGVPSADAGQQRLMDLGVPESLARKHSERTKKMAPISTAQSASSQKSDGQTATAAANNPTAEGTETDGKPKKPTFKELMDDPDYNKEMQAIIQQRLKSSKGAEDALGKLAPAIEVLARKYGQDPTKPDYDALAKAINDEDGYYEDKALQMGVSVETAKKMDQQEREAARKKRQEAMTLEEQKFRQHFQKLEQQAAQMKATFPDFDLQKELQNPAFARMTSPNIGLSVEDAYYAVHRKELQTAAMQVAAQKTAQKISNSIQAGSRRPQENGTSAQAPSVTTFDYRAADKQQREAFKRDLQQRWARGEKVYPRR